MLQTRYIQQGCYPIHNRILIIRDHIVLQFYQQSIEYLKALSARGQQVIIDGHKSRNGDRGKAGPATGCHGAFITAQLLRDAGK